MIKGVQMAGWVFASRPERNRCSDESQGKLMVQGEQLRHRLTKTPATPTAWFAPAWNIWSTAEVQTAQLGKRQRVLPSAHPAWNIKSLIYTHLFPLNPLKLKYMYSGLFYYGEVVDVGKLSVGEGDLGESFGCSIPPECHWPNFYTLSVLGQRWPVYCSSTGLPVCWLKK